MNNRKMNDKKISVVKCLLKGENALEFYVHASNLNSARWKTTADFVITGIFFKDMTYVIVNGNPHDSGDFLPLIPAQIARLKPKDIYSSEVGFKTALKRALTVWFRCHPSNLTMYDVWDAIRKFIHSDAYATNLAGSVAPRSAFAFFDTTE